MNFQTYSETPLQMEAVMSIRARKGISLRASSRPRSMIAARANATAVRERDRVLAQYILCVGAIHDVEDEIARREALLPEWARPGPMYLDASGNYVGEVVDWPRVDNVEGPAQHGVLRLVRPSFKSIIDGYRILGGATSVHRKVYRQRAFAEIRLLLLRLRAVQMFRSAQRLDELEVRRSQLLTRQEDLAEILCADDGLPFERCATNLLLSICDMRHEGEAVWEQGFNILDPLAITAGMCSGLTRLVADDLLQRTGDRWSRRVLFDAGPGYREICRRYLH